ncbi:MAG: hypothetical protein AAGM22_13460 [Acidobacteriota bacterium]
MKWPEQLLWTDGLAGAAVGVGTLALAGWLSQLYRLPKDFVLLIAAANLIYGAYSLTIARLHRRPVSLIIALALANTTWAVLCFRWVYRWHETASFFGLFHLGAEGLFCLGLAALEWRLRHQLTKP